MYRSPLTIELFIDTGLLSFLPPYTELIVWAIIAGTLSSITAYFLCRGRYKYLFTQVVMSFFAGAGSPQLTIGLLVAMRISHYFQSMSIENSEPPSDHAR